MRVPAAATLEVESVIRRFFYPEKAGAPRVVQARVARVEAQGIGIEYHEPRSVPPSPVAAAAGPDAG